MVQFRTLLILFVVLFAIIFIAYAEAEGDKFAVKRHSRRDSRSIGPISVSNRQRRAFGYGLGYGYAGYGYAGYGTGGYGYGGYGYYGYPYYG